jgi:hypothetical protein
MPGDPCELINVAGDASYLPILNSMRYRLNALKGATPEAAKSMAARSRPGASARQAPG